MLTDVSYMVKNRGYPNFRLSLPEETQLWSATVNGASVRTGDLFASGTVSGPAPDTVGSLIELTANGERPLSLADGSTRRFLDDGDEVVISATAPAVGGGVVGLGEVRGRILPATR